MFFECLNFLVVKKMPHFSMLILTVGVPGSGKTRWVNEYTKQHPYTHVVSTDAIRKECTGVEQCIDPSQNDWIHDEARRRVKNIIDDPHWYAPNAVGFGPEIIVDSTNVNVDEWIKYKALKPSVILAKVFNTPVDEAMKNQENRERKVPREIVQMKWDELQKNKKYLPFIFNMILD